MDQGRQVTLGNVTSGDMVNVKDGYFEVVLPVSSAVVVELDCALRGNWPSIICIMYQYLICISYNVDLSRHNIMTRESQWLQSIPHASCENGWACKMKRRRETKPRTQAREKNVVQCTTYLLNKRSREMTLYKLPKTLDMFARQSDGYILAIYCSIQNHSLNVTRIRP